MSLMTEVLTSANEAERRGKNGPVGWGLAGEPGDVSSAPGSAAASTTNITPAARASAGALCPASCGGWGCSALTCRFNTGNSSTIKKRERFLGIYLQAMFSFPHFCKHFQDQCPLHHPLCALKGVFCKGANTKCEMQNAKLKGKIHEQGLRQGIHCPLAIQIPSQCSQLTHFNG